MTQGRRWEGGSGADKGTTKLKPNKAINYSASGIHRLKKTKNRQE